MIVEPPGGAILAVAAHPDDVESWCAGTLAQAIDAGATVRLLLVTSGDKGSDVPTATAAAVARRREQESVEAAPPWTRGGHPALAPGRPVHPRPRAPLSPVPDAPRHRVVGRAALDAAYPLARDRLCFPEQVEEGLSPHAIRQVWLFSSDRPTAYVDISAGFERKIAARLAHESQTRDPPTLRAGWRARAARIGAEAGLPLAEAFVVLRLD